MNSSDTEHFTRELDDLSDRLACVAADMKEKLQNVRPKRQGGDPDEERRLFESAKQAQDAMDEFLLSLQDIEISYDRDSKFRSMAQYLRHWSSDLMAAAPMSNNPSWDIYATNPVLPVRLAIIISSPLTRNVVQDMTTTQAGRYVLFEEAVISYLGIFERGLFDM